MFEIQDLSNEIPYLIFEEKYKLAIDEGQKNIEAISISSYNKELDLVDSRYVNLKFVDGKKFIFFSNYESPKSIAFRSHDQISALIYWSSINVQIRMRANIHLTSKEFNKNYFKQRSKEKNALAISSKQSSYTESYEQVKKNYFKTLSSNNLRKCPEYWGGYYFVPYYFEFWEGHKSRLNKRDAYELIKENWNHFVLQP